MGGAQGQDDGRPIGERLGADGWTTYFPFRLGDSWTYDWTTEGPYAPKGSTARTRVFDGTEFVHDTVGYKLVSDDGTYHLYTFEDGILSIHTSSEGDRLVFYDPPVILAAPELRPGVPHELVHTSIGRRWVTTLVGLESVTVPLGTFDRSMVIRLQMTGPDFVSDAHHVFAPHVGLVAYRYILDEAGTGRRLLAIDAKLRLARLSGISVASAADLERVVAASTAPMSGEDPEVRGLLKRALDRRYTWDAKFPGFRGDVELVEEGASPVRGRFQVDADLSVTIDAPDDGAKAALRNEISSFITQRKHIDFDLTYAETTFRQQSRGPEGMRLVAEADPLATAYTVSDGEITEVGRSVGRLRYVARDRSKLRTEDNRTITTAYDVVYMSNEDGTEVSVERTQDTYAKVGGYWIPTGRRMVRSVKGEPPVVRELRLTNLKAGS